MEDFNEVLEGVEDSLFGIGAMNNRIKNHLVRKKLDSSPQMVQAVKQVSAQRAQMAMSKLTKSQALMIAKAGDLDPSARAKFANGEFIFQDGDMYVRKAVAGGGTIELIDDATIKDFGRSAFHGNRFPDNVNLTCDKIGVTYATAAPGVTDVAAQKYSADGNRLPVALCNAIFVLTIDDKPVQQWRLSKFFSDSTTAMVPNMKSDDFAVTLDAPKLLKSGVPIGFRIIMPSGQTLSGAATHFLEVALFGAQTGTRSTS